MRPRRARDLGLRIAIAFAVSIAVVLYFREAIFRFVLPLYLGEMTLLAHDFRIGGIDLRGVGADHYIYGQAVLVQPVLAGGKVIYPEQMGNGEAFTLSGYVPQTIILFFGVLLAWRAARWRSYAARGLVGLPALVLMLMLDIPFTLVGFLEGNLSDPFWLRQYVYFFNYGVRLVLAVTAEELASIGAEYLTIGWKSPTLSCRQTGAGVQSP